MNFLTRNRGGYLSAVLFVLALSANTVTAQERPDTNLPTKVFHLANAGSREEANDVVVALRNVISPTDKIFLLQSTNDVIVSASAEELAKIGGLLSELDKSKHTYRITYTLAESDAGKRIGIHHLSVVVLLGQRVTLKQGDKIPVVTGSYSTEKAAQENQFTYIDIGTNIDTTLDQFANGLRLRSKVEQSAVAQEHQSGMLADEPIVRQSVLEGTSVITPGKPTNLGGIDIVGSTRHIDIEVVAEQIS